MSMTDTAEYWFNKNEIRLPNMFRHADGVNCGHNHNTKDTIFIDDVECYACRRIIGTNRPENMVVGKAPETYYMSNKEKKNHNALMRFRAKNGKCPCGCDWQIRKRTSDKKEFLGCINYPNCKNTKNISL